MNTSEFLIFCEERTRDGIAYWWLPNELGYTPDVKAAGRYSVTHSVRIMKQARGEDFAVDAQLFIKDASGSFQLTDGPDDLVYVDLAIEYNRAVLDGYRMVATYLI